VITVFACTATNSHMSYWTSVFIEKKKNENFANSFSCVQPPESINLVSKTSPLTVVLIRIYIYRLLKKWSFFFFYGFLENETTFLNGTIWSNALERVAALFPSVSPSAYTTVQTIRSRRPSRTIGVLIRAVRRFGYYCFVVVLLRNASAGQVERILRRPEHIVIACIRICVSDKSASPCVDTRAVETPRAGAYASRYRRYASHNGAPTAPERRFAAQDGRQARSPFQATEDRGARLHRPGKGCFLRSRANRVPSRRSAPAIGSAGCGLHRERAYPETGPACGLRLGTTARVSRSKRESEVSVRRSRAVTRLDRDRSVTRSSSSSIRQYRRVPTWCSSVNEPRVRKMNIVRCVTTAA